MTNIEKCEVCGKSAHHIHHKDLNHKNNSPENLQYVCTLCHANIHDIDPNISELRKRVDYYMRIQKARIRFEHYLRAYEWMELIPPKVISDMLPQLKKLEKENEKSIKEYFKNGKDQGLFETHIRSVTHSKDGETINVLKPIKEMSPHPIYKWLTSIKGISDVLAGKFIAYIDIDKTPGIANLWKYAGLAPGQNRRKGNNNKWNHKLKSFCYQLGDSFIKQRTPKYRDIYDKEKEKQISICKEIDKKGWKGHADNRARRKMVKVFLKDLWIEWKGNDQHNNVKNTTPLLSIPSNRLKIKGG